jgi:NAD+ synthase
MNKQGIPRIFIGNSGGKDSAAALAIAVDAVGPDRVVSVRLPSQYTSQESMDLADELARNLGVRCETVCIDGPVQAFANLLAASPAANQTSADVADENIQARVRMMILMDMAKRQGGIVAGTSNKSESALGYGTLFADFGGDYNTIKDWYATEVPQNLLWRNTHTPAISLHPITGHIPLGIINRKPTAELRPDQSDAESLGAGYDVIDPILMGLIEDGLDATAARRQAEAKLNITIEPGFAAALENRLYGAEFKRSLVNVPGPQIREASFGLGRRYPIVNHYRSTERNPA